MLARTPAPPYYAVIFSSLRKNEDPEYAVTAAKMVELARQQPGFLGLDSAHEEIGITVSYWRDEAAIAAWKQQADHQLARRQGRETWYADFQLRVARVERAYGLFENEVRA